MDIDKNKLRAEFTKDWKKHYDVDILKQNSFSRQQCKKCKRFFWAQIERDYCADASCIGYQFIGKSPCKKKYGYQDAWKKIEKYFTKNGHTSIKPYPSVARWRDDLYFTVASINDFQPYVVSGELPPPANPLIVPQPCIRFPDISNVGVSGRHYTNFVMIGQHAFNTKETGLFYWKNEALGHDIGFMEEFGIPIEKLVFIEDVWAGGGNFGPCIEYFLDGLELGNCVFMQYETIGNTTRELKTKVIDMGAGLERFPWISQGTPTAYEISFRNTIEKMKKQTGISIDEKRYFQYAHHSGILNADEVDLEEEKKKLEKELGKEFLESIKPMQALYASADHTLTLLFSCTDGMLPSNAGGGYNLRMILRRVFGFEEEFKFELNFEQIIKTHAEERNEIFPHLKEGIETTINVVAEEKRKYLQTKEKAKGRVISIVKKGKITEQDFITLYKSEGIPPESVVEEAKKQKIKLDVPKNFYKSIQHSEGGERPKEQEFDVSIYPKTKKLYYENTAEFKAEVLGIIEKYLIFDRSAFYPESGGQIWDSGTINKIKVKTVINQSGVLLHEMEDISKFKKGQKIEAFVDLERRKTITRHHSAAHLLNAACRKVLGNHIWQAGSFKSDEKAHLDITHYKRISEEELNAIEIEVNGYISQNIPIEVEVLQRDIAEKKYGFRLYQGGAVPGRELRIAKIGNIDVEACGGTHHMLKSTGELGCFKIIKREGIQDGIERIEYKCADVAIIYMQEKEKMLKSSCLVLSVPDEDLKRTIERFFEEWKEQKKEIEQLKSKIAGQEAQKILKSRQQIFLLDYDVATLRQIASLAGKETQIPVAIINKENSVICFCNKDSKTGAKEFLDELVKKYGGSGGGSKEFASGKLKNLPE
ncbi:MAG: alanine--tRNA ligase [Candidatus Micrarchaeia archaeon]